MGGPIYSVCCVSPLLFDTQMIVNGMNTINVTNQFVRIVNLTLVVDNACELDVSFSGHGGVSWPGFPGQRSVHGLFKSVYLLSRRSSAHSPSTAHAAKATSAHTASE
jgi:hypothetical protein